MLACWLRVVGLLACAGALACEASGIDATRTPPAPPHTRAEPVPVAIETCALGAVGPDGANALERALREAIVAARFDEVIDLGAGEPSACAAGGTCRPLGRAPHVDAAVIAFPTRCPPVFANAILSPAAPGVHLVRFDPSTLAPQNVRYLRWSQERWDAGAGHDRAATGTGDDDVVVTLSGVAAGALPFELPYPASNFKLLVAIAILGLVDRGALRLEHRLAHEGRTREIREWLGDMITWSDDDGAEALVRELHARGEMPHVAARFARLGLSTLRLDGTSATTGRSWRPGKIHMSAWDTARLLWLLDPDAPLPSWIAPDGARVDSAFLTAGSRQTLLTLLEEQALHDALSTTGLCGRPGTTRGIPARMPPRWIGHDGSLLLAGGAATDVRPCDAAAEVGFAHKTGLTRNFGSDAGIVRGIPGRARRHYIVAFFSNLGHRYTDADEATGPRPCHDLGICYTRRIAAMAAALDAAMAKAWHD